MHSNGSETFIRTFARGLKVIETLGKHGSDMNIAGLALETGLSRSVVKRYLLTLIELGYVKPSNKGFALTSKVLNLGLSYLYSLPFWRQAQLELEELSHKIKQSCAMSILDSNDIVYVVRVPIYRILRSSPTLGTRLPANVVSMGRVLLAELNKKDLEDFFKTAPLNRLTNQTITDKVKLTQQLDEVREAGYAWVNGDFNETICGLAVPIRDINGIAVAAINVSLPSDQFSKDSAVNTFLHDLRRTAAILSATL